MGRLLLLRRMDRRGLLASHAPMNQSPQQAPDMRSAPSNAADDARPGRRRFHGWGQWCDSLCGHHSGDLTLQSLEALIQGSEHRDEAVTTEQPAGHAGAGGRR